MKLETEIILTRASAEDAEWRGAKGQSNQLTPKNKIESLEYAKILK